MITGAEAPPGELSTRILLLTGKGGVGKTSVAAATAVQCADAGLRTVVISTDPAHSLADVFDSELGPDPRPVEGTDHLWGQELDAAARLEASWGTVRDFLVDFFRWAGLEPLEAEELAVVPGLEELFALTDLRRIAESGEWDVVVVDCAPSAETIRLLSLPDVLARYADRLFPIARAMTNLARPVLSQLSTLPVASEAVFDAIGELAQRLEGVHQILADPALTTARLVVTPERVVVAEARRLATYLALFGYGTDAVVVNRVLPASVTDPWFERWRELQSAHIRDIEQGFAPLPVLRGELEADELTGVDRLRSFGARLYGDVDASLVLHKPETMTTERRGDDTVLCLHLPFAARGDLDVGLSEDELLVRVGPHRRAVTLPDHLRRRPIGGATMMEERLEVVFARREDAE